MKKAKKEREQLLKKQNIDKETILKFLRNYSA